MAEKDPNNNTTLDKVPKSECSQPEVRINSLWRRAKVATLVVSKFKRMNSHIRQFGAKIHSSIIGAPQSSVDSQKGWLLYPKGRFKRFWDFIILLILCWTAIVMPFRLSFVEEPSPTVYYLEMGIDFLFFLDIVINFFSAYYDKFDNLVTDKGIIAQKYARSWLFIDIFSCFPFQLLGQDSDEQSYNKFLRLLRFQRFYKILKIFRLMKMVRVFHSKRSLVKLINNLRANYGVIRLIYFFMISVVLVHFLACFWFFLAKMDTDSNTWIRFYDIERESVDIQYLTSIYWVFATLTSVGYGDIYPHTNLEKIFASVVMVFGFGFYSYVIGNVSSIISNMDFEINQREMRISAFNELSKVIRLPSDLMERVKTNVYFLHNPKFFNKWDQSSFIKSLPINLKSSVSQFLHKKFTKNIRFFNDKHELLLLYVVPKLKISQLFRKDALYFNGDPAEEVYFIHMGRVVFRANNGVAYRNYSQGSYFGECEVLYNENRTETVQVSSNSAVLYILVKKHFFEMLSEFLDVDLEVREVAAIREQKHSLARQHAMSLLPNQTNSVFSQVDHNLNFTPKQPPLKMDTYQEVKMKNKNDRSLRYEFLWQNVGKSANLGIMQNTFVSSQLREGKRIMRDEPAINVIEEVDEDEFEFGTLDNFIEFIRERPMPGVPRGSSRKELAQNLNRLLYQ